MSLISYTSEPSVSFYWTKMKLAARSNPASITPKPKRADTQSSRRLRSAAKPFSVVARPAYRHLQHHRIFLKLVPSSLVEAALSQASGKRAGKSSGAKLCSGQPRQPPPMIVSYLQPSVNPSLTLLDQSGKAT